MAATTTAETGERHVCRACGYWRCNSCGWQRSQANRFFDDHQCPKCGSTDGRFLPVKHTSWSKRHDHDQWADEMEEKRREEEQVDYEDHLLEKAEHQRDVDMERG